MHYQQAWFSCTFLGGSCDYSHNIALHLDIVLSFCSIARTLFTERHRNPKKVIEHPPDLKTEHIIMKVDEMATATIHRQLSSEDDDSYNVSETEQLENTLYINIIIFSCLTVLFEILRHMKSIYMNRYKKKFIEENRVPKKPSSLPFGWVYTIFTVSHDDVLRMVGLDGYILLRYLMTCIRIATFCAFWGLIVIVPVYGSGSVGLTGWNKYTIANVPDDPGSNQLWVPVIFSYIFAMFYCQLLYFEYKNFIHKRVMYLEDGDPETPVQTYYTVMLEKIPASLRSTTILKDFFERLFPGDLFAVEIALDLNELDELATRRKQVRNSLEKSIAIWKGTGKRPRTLVKKDFYDNEVPNKPIPVQEWSMGAYFGYELYDSIEHYSKLLSILNQNVKQMQLVYIEQRHRLNEIENNRLEEIRKVYAIRALETASKQVKRFAGNLKDTSTKAAGTVVTNILHFKDGDEHHHYSHPQDSVDIPDEEAATAGVKEALIRDSDENHRSVEEIGVGNSKRESDGKSRESESSRGERKSDSSKSKLKNIVENSSARAQEVIHMGAKIVGSGVEGLAKEGLKTAKFATKGALRGVYEATRALELLTLGAYYKTSSTAFITFKTRFSACCCQQMLLSHEHYMIDVTAAPNPNDVIWQNVSIPSKQIEIRKQISDSTLIVGAFFWSIVVAFISAISNLESLSQEIPSLQEYSNTQIYKFLNNYLAVGILLILLALLPFVFDFISRNYEGVKLESEIQNSIMSRYFYYQLANVFVAVGLGSIANSIHEILQNPSSILSILGSSVPSFSIYFANLIITRAFTGIPIEMLRIFPLLDIMIVQYCSNKKKLTRRELMEGAFADPPMVYGWIYPNILMGLMIMVTYSCVSTIPFSSLLSF